MSTEKSQPRLAVETALQRAQSPITVEDIATRTGLHTDTVRSHLNNCLNHGLVRNTCPGAKPATYVWGSAPPPVVTPEQRSCWTMGTTYTGEKAAPLREGSMRPFEIPSIGQEVRIRPFSLSSSASTNLNARPL